MAKGIEFWAYKMLEIMETGKADSIIKEFGKDTIDGILSANQNKCLSILEAL